ncbi:aldolase/citrate lyase family protein [Microbispora sp. H11081]|uniref:HpcH/HpaI aldolase/citrate lyase family protein n=1 Tax=Microbispora sp. H11081 TaxID=2729107 RepID=UPI001472BE36|nr:aldolase/citrate lyase family protein [Microbispora sp. H11081]
MTPRSYLYVPADQSDKLAKSRGSEADALILDLEDAVAAGSKETARKQAAEFVVSTGPEQVAPALWVRVNAETVEDDVAAVAVPGLVGVVVPKADPAILARADAALTRAESSHGLGAGTFAVLALIESALGVARAEDVAAAPRVVRLGLGEADLAGELGLRPGPAREELWPIRSRIVVASAVAGILAPVGPVDTAVRDTGQLQETTRILLRQGFRARTAISPRQLAVINEVFTPDAAELAEARDVLDRLAEAERRGSGVALDAAGRLIDAAVARTAREVVGRAR